jgi:hypothetical protein
MDFFTESLFAKATDGLVPYVAEAVAFMNTARSYAEYLKAPHLPDGSQIVGITNQQYRSFKECVRSLYDGHQIPEAMRIILQNRSNTNPVMQTKLYGTGGATLYGDNVITYLTDQLASIQLWMGTARVRTNTLKNAHAMEMIIPARNAVACLNPLGLPKGLIAYSQITSDLYHAGFGYSQVSAIVNKKRLEYGNFWCRTPKKPNGVWGQVGHFTKGMGSSVDSRQKGRQLFMLEEARTTVDPWRKRPICEHPLYAFHAMAWARRMYGERMQEFGLDPDPFYGQTVESWTNKAWNGIPTYLVELACFIAETEKWPVLITDRHDTMVRTAVGVRANAKPLQHVVLSVYYYDNMQTDSFDADLVDALPSPPSIDGNKPLSDLPVIRGYKIDDCPHLEGWYDPGFDGPGLRRGHLQMLWLMEMAALGKHVVLPGSNKSLEQWSHAYNEQRYKFLSNELFIEFHNIAPDNSFDTAEIAQPSSVTTTEDQTPVDDYDIDEIKALLDAPIDDSAPSIPQNIVPYTPRPKG